VGVRHIAEDEADAGWLARDAVAEGVAAVGAAGLAYDLLVRPPHLMRARHLPVMYPPHCARWKVSTRL
jgi:L-fuconolactonase